MWALQVKIMKSLRRFVTIIHATTEAKYTFSYIRNNEGKIYIRPFSFKEQETRKKDRVELTGVIVIKNDCTSWIIRRHTARDTGRRKEKRNWPNSGRRWFTLRLQDINCKAKAAGLPVPNVSEYRRALRYNLAKRDCDLRCVAKAVVVRYSFNATSACYGHIAVVVPKVDSDHRHRSHADALRHFLYDTGMNS